MTVTVTTATPTAPTCTLTASPTSIQAGDSSTLSWTTANAGTFSINNGVGSVTPVVSGSKSVSPTTTTTYTGTVTDSGGFSPSTTGQCSVTVTVTTGGGGCTSNCGGGGGGGGGGGSTAPTIILAALPHVISQPLAYLYLSQIPKTGLSLGPIGTTVYWLALIGWALALAYLILFGAMPLVSRRARSFGARVMETLNTRAPVSEAIFQNDSAPLPLMAQAPHEAPRGYSSYDGFKSFARGGALSIEDIVKGLARSHPAPIAERSESIRNVEPVYEKVEPIYENVEPIYENVEPIAVDTAPASAPTHVRGFISALVEGDRSAVFAGLRQHVRGGGSSEQLISATACLLDDAYRARIDGSACDAGIARVTARLNTPILEKLVASLATAIDSSYSAGVTGAKLALTRALTVLGA